MLAADTHLQVVLDRSPALDRNPHQVADPLLVEHLERVPLEHAVLEVAGEELALGVVAREAERRLRQVVRAEGEEVRGLGDLVGAHARTRELDHRPDEVLEARRLLLPEVLGQRAQAAQLLGEPHERMHHLDEGRLARPLGDGARGTRDRADLHLVDLRKHQPEAATSSSEHRIGLA